MYLHRLPDVGATQPQGSIPAAVAGPRTDQVTSFSLPMSEGTSMLQRFFQAARDPRLVASIDVGTPELVVESQQQQQCPQEGYASQMDGVMKCVGQGSPPGGRTRVEADAAELAVKHYGDMRLGPGRSPQEAEQDRRGQQELQRLSSAGQDGDLPAPAQPQVEP